MNPSSSNQEFKSKSTIYREQKEKDETSSQNDEEEMDLLEVERRTNPYFETELPKTINNLFGSLSDFLVFFSRRSPEMLEFTQTFKELERSKDLELLHSKILPKLVHGLQEHLQISLQEYSSNSFSRLKEKLTEDMKKRNEELISLFMKKFSSLKEFYQAILRAYTMNTSLSRNLDKYLRYESWSEIDNLLPYAFCLCQAFFNPELQTNSFASEISSQESNPIVLYRGTLLDKHSIQLYDTEKIKYFSWNSVTSTSKSENIAEKFMKINTNIEKKKYPVLFRIEVPTQENFIKNEYLKWIDINQYSSIQREEEVILPPGSVFELQEVEPEGEKIIIRLKLKNQIESLAYGGLIMQGTFQSEMMKEKEAKIMCRGGEELHEALQVLMGNTLIEQLGFCMCTFDQLSLEKVFAVFSSSVKISDLRFISCTYKDKKGISNTALADLKRCNISKLEISEISDFYENLYMSDDSNWESLRSLTLDFGSLRKITDEGVLEMRWKVLGGLKQLMSLSLDFSGCSQITNKGISNLCSQGLEQLTQLLNFSLNLSGCFKLTDEGMGVLCNKVLKNQNHLESLMLNFSECQGITDKGVMNLASQALKDLTELESLDLSFSECRHVTDRGMHNLFSESLNKLVELISLNLNFNWNSQILNKEISYLCSQWRMHFTQLEFLNLDFNKCMQITDEEINRLCFQGLKFMKQLIFLKISFSFCTKVTDKGLATLCDEGLKYLTKLKSLKLNFCFCSAITDKGIDTLCSKGLKDLPQLTSLDLDFSDCNKITEKGFNNLFAHGINHLSQLTSLNINSKAYPIVHADNQNVEQIVSTKPRPKFVYQRVKNPLQSQNSKINTFIDAVEFCKKLFLKQYFLEKRNQFSKEYDEDKIWSFEDIQILFNLSQIATLNLDFCWCEQTIKEANTKCSQGLREYFTQLKSINLKFYLCGGITDRGISNLCSLDFSLLNQLTSLNLDFRECGEITDEGIETLCSEVFKYLAQLTSLDLNFSNCEKITDKTFNAFCCQGLKHLPHLTSLSLCCSGCEAITDEAISIFYSQGFQHLGQLRSLNLDFSKCYRITLQGIKTLFSDKLQNLQNLMSFALKLQGMQMKNSGGGEDNFSIEGLSHLETLRSLSLDFEECMQITDEGIHNLCSRGLRYITGLESLTLNFSFCPQVTNEGVQHLCSHGLKYLTQLKLLTLNFSLCHEITDEGIETLCWKGLRYLTQLKSLHLDFSRCKLTDEGINVLCSKGLTYLTQLTSLDLHLCHLTELTNKGINILCVNGLRYLFQLISLTLSFVWCEEITDEGVNNLCSQLGHLSQLESLNFDFSNCKQITSFTMSNIDEVFGPLAFRNEE